MQAALDLIGPDARSLRINAGDPEQLREAVATVEREQGRIDSLVINAGIAEPDTIDEITEDHFDRHVELNVRGPVFALQAALPAMRPGSTVVLIGSIAGSIGTRGYGVYGASKAGADLDDRTRTQGGARERGEPRPDRHRHVLRRLR